MFVRIAVHIACKTSVHKDDINCFKAIIMFICCVHSLKII